MLGVRLIHPHTPPAVSPEETMQAVIDRAVEAADDVGGAFSASPCRFVHLPTPPAGESAEATWILVVHAHSAEPDHAAHLRERSRTAIQRFTLALQCDDIDALWVDDAAAAAAALDSLGGGPWEPMGLVRCAPIA